jgi:hypothetical protein
MQSAIFAKLFQSDETGSTYCFSLAHLAHLLNDGMQCDNALLLLYIGLSQKGVFVGQGVKTPCFSVVIEQGASAPCWINLRKSDT